MAKECIHHGCHVLVSKGSRCPEHNVLKQYKKERKDTVEQKFYTSTEWRKLRQKVMAQHNHLCVRCLNKGVLSQATDLDHIIPVKIDWGKRLDPTNLQPLCVECHRVKGQEEKREYGSRLQQTNTNKRQSVNDFYSNGGGYDG